MVDLTALDEVTELFARTWWSHVLLVLGEAPQTVPVLSHRINAQVGGVLRDGQLYRALRELEAKGLIENQAPTEGRAGPWRLTDAGEQRVDRLLRVKRAFERHDEGSPDLPGTAPDAGPTVSGPGVAVRA